MVTLSAHVSPPALMRKPVVSLARDLRLRHDRGRIELIGDGRQPSLHVVRRLEPKLEMIERPGALLALDLGRLGLDPGFDLATGGKGDRARRARAVLPAPLPEARRWRPPTRRQVRRSGTAPARPRPTAAPRARRNWRRRLSACPASALSATHGVNGMSARPSSRGGPAGTAGESGFAATFV